MIHLYSATPRDSHTKLDTVWKSCPEEDITMSEQWVTQTSVIPGQIKGGGGVRKLCKMKICAFLLGMLY